MQSQIINHPYSSQRKNQFATQELKVNSTKQPIKTFPIIYNNTTFMVDPYLLMISSLRFKELVDPYMKDNYIKKAICLKIVGNEFSNKTMDNFLKLCQYMKTNIKNSEMEEICKIAKIFQADNVYQRIIPIAHKDINPNFIVSTSKFNESQKFMYIESINNYKENKRNANLKNESDKLINYI